MKYAKWKFLKDRLYEIYLYLNWDGFHFAFCIADVDFQLSLTNCRDMKIEEYLKVFNGEMSLKPPTREEWIKAKIEEARRILEDVEDYITNPKRR